MGKSSGATSCFKLIACGGGNESVDRDDLEAGPETKGSSGRSRWSFHKRSARHRVLTNSVASEATSGNKTSSVSGIGGLPTQGSSATPEKSSVIQWSDEKPQVQIPVESKFSETIETVVVAEDDIKADELADEESIIVIQTAIRRFQAQRILVKHKNFIKLQAAVRGHIVRRHAAGSLRCVQAIVKMQHLVRERRARLHVNESSTEEKAQETTAPKPGTSSTSTEKLLSNAFARQLLESTPKTKAINIKCDPAKSDSAWRWLERWMSVSSTESEHSHEIESILDQRVKDNIEEADKHLETVISSPENSQSKDEVYVDALPVPLESDENVIKYDVDNYKIQEHQPIVSSVVTSNDQFGTHSRSDTKSSAEDSSTVNARESDLVTKTESEFLSIQCAVDNEQNIPFVEARGEKDSEIDNQQNIPTVETPDAETCEVEGKKSFIGSRKASNPAFVEAETKFEELGSAASLGSVGSSNLEVRVDSSLDAELSVINQTSKASEIDHAESSLSHKSTGQVNASECGTELSISSTLDSPDRSEAGVVDSVPQTKSADEIADNPKNDLISKVEEKIESTMLEVDSSNSNLIVQEMDDCSIVASGEHVDSSYLDPIVHEGDESNVSANKEHTEVNGDSSEAEQNPVTTATTEVHMEREIETSEPVRRLSPEASTVSRVTVADSQGTPSSQVSVKSKKTRSSKNGSFRRSLSNGKESNLDGARNSSEHKNEKRRNSFSSSKTDHSENQEPRNSSSSSSLPSYMQTTESARAKALPHNSPRSSPDMQDKDLLIKKRHSLPSAATRQGSPRVIRAQQAAKGSETQSPQERKWRR